jgi:hypothetical protein
MTKVNFDSKVKNKEKVHHNIGNYYKCGDNYFILALLDGHAALVDLTEGLPYGITVEVHDTGNITEREFKQMCSNVYTHGFEFEFVQSITITENE